MENIVINMNSGYFKYSIVMLSSLFYNNTDMQFDIYLLYSDMKTEELEYLKRFAENNNSRFIHISVDPNRFANFPMNNRWTIETYYRLLISELLPHSVKRVLYLDIDVIIDGKLNDLFCTNIDHYYLAACKDICEGIDYKILNRKWGRDINTPYFNAGVMLLNLEKIRNDIAFGDYVTACQKCQCELPYMDQDLLNYSLGNEAYIFENNIYNDVVRPEDTVGTSVIYHYGTPAKPWLLKSDEKYYQIWWKYAQITEFYK